MIYPFCGINPAQVQVIMKWALLVQGEDMVWFLEAEFFDKWLHV